MLSNTATIKKLGMTFDYDKVAGAKTHRDYDDIYSSGSVYSVRSELGRTEVTIMFDTGDTLTLINPEMEVERTIDLEVGKIYYVGDRKRKWLAICVEQDEDPFLEDDELSVELHPIMSGGDLPVIDNDDRFDYEFYEEFDLDLSTYL